MINSNPRFAMWVTGCYALTGAATAPASAQDGASSTSVPAIDRADDAPLLDTIPVSGTAATPEPPDRRASDDSNQIEEVLVTATKRTESIRDIPASIAAFTGDNLEKQGKTSLNDFIQETPGVVAAHASTGYTNITVRGITTDTRPISNIPSTVGVFIGDSAFTDPYMGTIVPDLSAFDLAGVQILKGPQGTLFGGAALSGAIRYELNEPVLDEWQARGFSQYVSADGGGSKLTEGVAANAPLFADTFAVRLGYVHLGNPGIYDNQRPGFEKKNVDHGSGHQYRGIALWTPTENSRLKYTHVNQNYYAPNAQTRADSPDGPRESTQYLLPDTSRNKFSLDSLEADYDFEAMRVVSLTSRVDKDGFASLDFTSGIAGSPTPAAYPQAAAVFLANAANTRSWSQELRLQSTGTAPFKWLVGGYFFDYRLHGYTLLDTAAHQGIFDGIDSIDALPDFLTSAAGILDQQTALIYDDKQARSQEQALFTDLSYKLWQRLDLSVGARVYQTYVDGGIKGTGLLVRAENQGSDSDLRRKLKEHGISPKFSATYHFTDDVSTYASASRGFRFGGIQQVAATDANGVPPTYKSDSLWNYETGLRTNWLDNSLHADLTLFYIDYRNPIILQTAAGALPLQYLDNVGAAVSRGFEASLLWKLPIRGLAASVSGGLTDAHITEPFEAANGSMARSGDQLPGAAKAQYNGSLQYFLPLGLVNVDGNVSYTYVGKGYGDITHTVPINDYGTLNAGISFSSEVLPAHPRLSFNLSNITNEVAVVSGVIAPSTLGPDAYYYVLNTPRIISARLSLDF
jgi:iron complex outermembrane receptor protein